MNGNDGGFLAGLSRQIRRISSGWMTLAALAVFVLFIPLVMARYPALTPGIAVWLWRRFAGRAPAR